MPFAMPPGLRIAYDSDGTVPFYRQASAAGGTLQQMHPNSVAAMNSTFGGGAFFAGPGVWPSGSGLPNDATLPRDPYPFFTLIFPLPTRLRGLFYSGASVASALVEVSKDTTNGMDGTWDTLGSFSRGNIPETGSGNGATVIAGTDQSGTIRNPKDYYRLIYPDSGAGIHQLSGLACRNVKAIRVFPLGTAVFGFYHLHLYGEPDSQAAGENYLQAWRSDSDMRLGGATLSWGDVPAGSSSDKTFRVKNMSNVDTANSVLVSVEDLYYYPTPVAPQFLLSLDGVTWTSTVTIGAIGPGSVSGTIYIRRVTPLNSPLTTWSPKMKFAVGSWS